MRTTLCSSNGIDHSVHAQGLVKYRKICYDDVSFEQTDKRARIPEEGTMLVEGTTWKCSSITTESRSSCSIKGKINV